MKNKKVFTLLSLAIVSGILSGCQNGKGVTPGSDVVPSKEEVFERAPGEFCIIFVFFPVYTTKHKTDSV